MVETEAAKLTQMLREGTEEGLRGIRRCLAESGLDPDEVALADLFEDDERCLFGVLVAPDGRAFTFDYRWEDEALDDGRLLSLKDITDTWEGSPYWPEVKHGRRLLRLS